MVAAALSLHKDPRGWQKALWLLLIGGFLWVELHAIRVDRAEADRHAEEERAAQEKNFSDVRTQQNKNFGTTAKTLETAISGIQ